LVPVGDCIAATGVVVVVGCDGWGGGGKRMWGLRMIEGAVNVGLRMIGGAMNEG
jgi:hypothetical protein